MIALYRSDYNSNNGTYSPTLVATYSYDPWGAPTGIYSASGTAISQTASNVAAYNPFRYRGYRYDGDTRLYYLQSRYYDPAIGRFINADVYASTGQGFIGHNMFSYCGNNPIRYIDLAGEYYQPWHDKYVHDQVLKDIAAGNPDLHMHFTCIKYLDENKQPTGKYGFCDLYHEKTGEVWELKKNSTSPSCLTENALKQLDGYISGRLLHKPGLELKKPYITEVVTGVKHITRYRGNWIYEIDYWYEGNGILRYSYEKRYNLERAYAEALALALVATIAVAPYAAVGCAGAGALATLF